MNNQIKELVKQAEGIIFPYSENFEEAHVAFAKKMWPQKRRRHNPGYNRWKFRGLKNGTVDGLLLAVINEQVVGQLGLIPVTLCINGQYYPAQWACDLNVDPAMRRKKLGSLLLAYGMNKASITLGSNPSTSAEPTMERLGFNPLKGPRNMVLPLNPLYDIRIRLPEKLQRFVPTLTTLVTPFVNMRNKKILNYKTNSKVHLGLWSDVASLIQEQVIEYPHIFHGFDFLQWRCKGFSTFSPELFSISMENGSFAVFQDTPNVFYVYEWRAPRREDTWTLFNFIANYAKSKKCQSISAMANSIQAQSWLNELGFLTTRTPVKVLYYPEEPLHKYNYFHYCIYDSDGNL